MCRNHQDVKVNGKIVAKKAPKEHKFFSFQQVCNLGINASTSIVSLLSSAKNEIDIIIIHDATFIKVTFGIMCEKIHSLERLNHWVRIQKKSIKLKKYAGHKEDRFFLIAELLDF